jgi:hypothetical protein
VSAGSEAEGAEHPQARDPASEAGRRARPVGCAFQAKWQTTKANSVRSGDTRLNTRPPRVARKQSKTHIPALGNALAF